MAKVKNMVGQKFGRLTAIELLDKGKRGYHYLFACDCGNTKNICGSLVRTGKTLSCGCLRSETTAKKNFVHGLVHTGAYQSWLAMKTRCTNPNQSAYKRYGGRGIGFDPSWKLFENFVADMGERPVGMTLERIDNSKGYCKSNCKWATSAEQSRNTRQNVMITHNGKTMCMTDWAKETGIPYPTIQDRVKRGLVAEQILGENNVCIT